MKLLNDNLSASVGLYYQYRRRGQEQREQKTTPHLTIFTVTQNEEQFKPPPSKPTFPGKLKRKETKPTSFDNKISTNLVQHDKNGKRDITTTPAQIYRQSKYTLSQRKQQRKKNHRRQMNSLKYHPPTTYTQDSERNFGKCTPHFSPSIGPRAHVSLTSRLYRPIHDHTSNRLTISCFAVRLTTAL